MAVDVAPLAIPQTPDVVHSPWSMFWWRMRHNPKAVIGSLIVVFLLAVAIIAPLIAPKDPADGELADTLASPGSAYALGADKNGRDIPEPADLRNTHRPRRRADGRRHFRGYRRADRDLGRLPRWLGRRDGNPRLGHAARVSAVVVGVCRRRRIRTRTPQVRLRPGHPLRPVHRARGPQRDTRAERDGLHRGGAALGYGQGRIIFRHILPNCISPIIVVSSIDFAYALLDLAALSYLGLGVQPPIPDWGTMLSEGQLVLLTSPHVALAAGLAIVTAVLGFNLLGDGLRDVLDPRQAQR